jgi:hypothetical protein
VSETDGKLMKREPTFDKHYSGRARLWNRYHEIQTQGTDR